MGGIINLKAIDGHRLAAYRALPDGGAPVAGLVVVQEIFGVNAHIRDVCDRFAAAGFAAVAPALFDRARPGVELDDDADGIAEGRGLREAVGVVGFCWGGSLAWLAATRLGVNAAVGYYGGQIAEHAGETPGCPVLLHFGETDASIPLADTRAIAAAHPDVTLHLYPAGHGFNCDRREAHHADSAALTRKRTLAFLDRHLGRPG